MAPAPTIHMKGPPSKQILPVAVFPDSLPHRKESFFLSIVIGQTHLHWAMHEGFDAECTASVFWKTSLITLPELKRAYLTPSDALAHHVPNQWRHYFFGGTKEEPAKSTKENAWRCCWNRPIPTIHVYLVTLGACLDDACIYLFSDLPARLYQLSASIFWPDSCFTTPPAQGPRGGAIHQDQQQDHLELVGMEIQRRAGIKAAVSLFGHPALVIDAGSFHGFWNYTATDCNGTMLGGGYAANMAFSWLVLYHATGSLPLIQYSKLMERYPQLTMAAADQAAATATPTVEGKEDASFDDAPPASVFSTSTEEAILADAVLTLGTRCRYIVNHWLHRVGKAEPPVDLEDLEKKPAATTATHVAAAAATTTSDNFTNDEEPTNKPPANSTAAASAGDNKKDNLAAAVAVDQTTTVMEEDAATYSPTAETSKMNRKRCIILTGAEKEFMIRLLQPDYGGVLEKNDDDVTTMPVVHQEFEIHSVKHLLVFAIGQVVYEQQRQHEQVERNSGSEQLRRDLMGLRVAMEFERPQQPDGDVWYRGSVIRINRGADEGRDWQESLDDDLYWIQFDDGDSQELTPFELYCALMKYHELGERDFDFGEADEDAALRKNEKIRDSKLYGEQLKHHSPMVQEALAKMEAEVLRKEREAERKLQENLKRQQERAAVAEDDDDAEDMETSPTPDPQPEDDAEYMEQEEKQEVDEAYPEPPEPGDEEELITGGKTPSRGRGRPKKASTTPAGSDSKKTKTKATPSSSSRKRIKSEEEEAPPKIRRVKKTDAESAAYVGKRVAKKFNDGNIYFGTVQSFSPGDPDDALDEDFWWIIYDDDDTEQYDENDMKKAFQLYTTKKHLDDFAALL